MPDRSSITYVPIAKLQPSQNRYASAQVQAKIERAGAQGHTADTFDQGKSLYGPNDAIPVILLKQANIYVLCDGHHAVLASLHEGAQTMPILVQEIYEGPLDISFWTYAQHKGYAYLKDREGKACPPPADWTSLQDDPVRYFVALAARKFWGPPYSLEHSIGALQPLWIKLGRGRRHFIEFELANRLVQHGFVYHYGDEKDSKQFQALIEQARVILLQSPVAGADVLGTSLHYAQHPEIENIISMYTTQ